MTEDAVRLLSIEDDPQVRSSLVTWLEDSGFTVIEAADGLSGLETFQAERPDLVLLDMGLPGMPGLDVLRAIAAEAPETPVVIVSANADISDAIGAFKAGAWDYVTKPIINFEALEQTIRNCLERRALRERVRQAEERYHALIQSVPVVVFSFGADGRMDFINDTCLEVTGYSADEALAEDDWLLAHAHPDDREALGAALDAARADPGAGFSVNFRFRHRKGYTLHLRARALEAGRGPAPTLGGVIADATEAVFLGKVLVQREKLKTLGAVSSELAHEIRNPLMSLGGFARRLAQSHPELEEPPIILEQAERLEALLARITTYLAPVQAAAEPVNLTAHLTFCLDRLLPSLVRRGLDIIPRLALDLPRVQADPELLTETLASILNHLTAAMTAEGRMTITTSQTAGYVRADFELTQPGLAPPQEDADLLQLPFEEDDDSLHLALAWRNMKSMNGLLSLTPIEGGILLTASLPLPGAADPTLPPD